MQTNDAGDAGQTAALENLVPELAKLGQLLAEEKAGQIKTLESFASDASLQRLEELAEQQRSEFDALDFIGRLRWGSGGNLWSDEEFHSNLLAWLLDPRASHGIGEGFLTNFLRETFAPSEVQDDDWTRTKIIREWPNEVDGVWGYLDILILNESEQTLCAIENKVFSNEHSEQLTRYRKALADSYPDFTRHHVFLTPRGALPYRDEEREFWQPSTYAAVLSIVQQIVDDNSNPIKEDVRSFLRQYATALRRNIVPETSIAQLARQIYLKHRATIELINQYKPNFPEETKPILHEAIARQELLQFDSEGPNIIRMRSVDWGRFAAFRTGTAWSSESVLTFEFDFRPQRPYHLVLMLGPGTDQGVRNGIYESVVRHPHLFRPLSQSLAVYSGLDMKGPMLSDADFDNWDDQDAIRSKVTSWVANFAEERVPGDE